MGLGGYPRGPQGLAGPPERPGVVGRPNRWAVSCREGLRGFFGGTKGVGGVGRPSGRARSGREAVPEGREESGVLQEGQER